MSDMSTVTETVIETEIKEIEEITTLYVMGFPQDLMYREVHNLFRFHSGYKRCTVNLRRAHPTVFVTFQTKDDAAQALEQLQGVTFDPENDRSVLRFEWAKKNTKSTNKTGAIRGRERSTKRPRIERSRNERRPEIYPPQQQAPLMSGYGAPQQQYAPLSHTRPQSNGGGMRRGPSGTPIQTLFVHGVDGANEEELKALAHQQPGLLQVRCSSKKGLVAWLHFQSVDAATSAAHAIDGVYLPGMTGMGVQADYAKKPMSYKGPPASSASSSSYAQYGAYSQYV